MAGRDIARDALQLAPAHWRRCPLKYLAEINAQTLPEDTDPSFQFRYVDISSVDPLRGAEPSGLITFKEAPSRARRVLRPGDVLVSTVRTYLRAIAPAPVSEEPLVASTGFAVITPGGDTDPDYLRWWLQSTPFVEDVVARSVGVSYPATTASEVGNIYAPRPSPEEQRRISAYLDRECRKLDRLAEEQAQLVALEDEAFTARVADEVFGSSTGAPTADRLPGLPRLPRHWTATLLRWAGASVQTGPFGSQLHVSDYIQDGVPVINPSHIRDGRLAPDARVSVMAETRDRLRRCALIPNDVVMARRGEMGRAALVSQDQDGWLLGTGSLRVRFPSGIYDGDYLRRFLQTSVLKQYFEAVAVGSTMMNLNTTLLGSMPLAIPPLEEQRMIAETIADLESRWMMLRSESRQALALIVDRRRALITAAVTGQTNIQEETA